jgi:hypothetical protein
MPFLAMMGSESVKDDAFLVVGEPVWHDKTELMLPPAISIDPLRAKVQKSNDILQQRVLSFGCIVLAATVFGGIHCIGWSFDFPSHTEQLLWRISSISITGIPLGFVIIVTILGRFKHLSGILVFLLTLLYILSRLLLLAVALTALRSGSIPSSAFQTVEWTTFLAYILFCNCNPAGGLCLHHAVES